MFLITSAELINISNVKFIGETPVWPPTNLETIAIKTKKKGVKRLELQDTVIERAKLVFSAPGEYHIQGSHLINHDRVSELIKVNHNKADVILFGGDLSGGVSTESGIPSSNRYHVHVDKGRLRVYGTGTQHTFGPADYRIDAPSALGPHLITFARSEGSNNDTAYPSTLVEVRPKDPTSQVDLVLKVNSGSWKGDQHSRFIDYNAAGNVWLLRNHADTGTIATSALVEGIAEGASVFATGNFVNSSNPTPVNVGSTGKKLQHGDVQRNPDGTVEFFAESVTDGIDEYFLPDEMTPPAIETPVIVKRPAVTSALPGMIDITTLNANGNVEQSDLQAESNFRALQQAFEKFYLTRQPIYIPAGNYRIKVPREQSCEYANQVDCIQDLTFSYRHTGGWIAGAGRDLTRIYRDHDEKRSVLYAKNMSHFTVQGITFETTPWNENDPIEFPAFALENITGLGAATQEVMFYDTRFDGGRESLGIGMVSSTQCSENMVINGEFKNARIGVGVGSFNALANIVVSSQFINNEIAIGHDITNSIDGDGNTRLSGGTWAVFDTDIQSPFNYQQSALTSIYNTSSGVWYFDNVIADSPIIMQNFGWNSNGRSLLIENSNISAHGTNIKYRNDGAMGLYLLRSEVSPKLDVYFGGHNSSNLIIQQSTSVYIDSSPINAAGEHNGEILINY
jgi:hypothetical protein